MASYPLSARAPAEEAAADPAGSISDMKWSKHDENTNVPFVPDQGVPFPGTGDDDSLGLMRTCMFEKKNSFEIINNSELN